MKTYNLGVAGWWLAIMLGFSQCGGSSQEQQEKVTAPTAENAAGAIEETAYEPKRILLCFGNSITAGYGVSLGEAYPAQLQSLIDNENLPWQVENLGFSGETTSGGLGRIAFVMGRYTPDIFLLELGGNDGLRGIATTETKRNLQQIMDSVRHYAPGVRLVLTGMEAPPNMGDEYTNAFREVFTALAQENPDALFIPFILEGVAGEPELNLEDGIHPTPEGHKKVAQLVWNAISPALKKPGAEAQ